MEWLLVDLEESRVRQAEETEATHVAISRYQDLLNQVRELEARNKGLYERLKEVEEKNVKLHEKLKKQIQNKRNWREKAQQTERDPAERGKLKGRKQIVHRWECYYSVRTVELGVQSEIKAVETVQEYVKTELPRGTGAEINTLYHDGVEWIAEIWIPIKAIKKGGIPLVEEGGGAKAGREPVGQLD